MKELRFGVMGAGFWAGYQLAAWQEVPGAQCVALCDPIRAKAEALAARFQIPAVYDSPEAMLQAEKLDFVDIITSIATHVPMVELAAKHGVGIICQKPMATTLAEAERLVETCQAAGVPFCVHENWRWQIPLLQVKRVLDSGEIGKPFRARIEMISGFDVFVNQPTLKELEEFILADMGAHILDLARHFFGEASNLYCQLHRVHSDIRGEDVATVMLEMEGTSVLCHMAYAGNYLEHDRFPETYCFIEGERGSLELGPDFWVRTTTERGTHAQRFPPPSYAWANPDYAVAQTSMVPCITNLLQAMRGEGGTLTTGEDNLRTLRLIFAAYQSARTGNAVRV